MISTLLVHEQRVSPNAQSNYFYRVKTIPRFLDADGALSIPDHPA